MEKIGFWTFFNDYSIRKYCLLLTSSLPQNLTWPFWVIAVKVIAEKTVLSEERNQWWERQQYWQTRERISWSALTWPSCCRHAMNDIPGQQLRPFAPDSISTSLWTAWPPCWKGQICWEIQEPALSRDWKQSISLEQNTFDEQMESAIAQCKWRNWFVWRKCFRHNQ